MADMRGGNGTEGLADVYDRLAPTLFRYALILMADRHEAEDVIQQVFAVLVRRGLGGLDSVDRYLRVSVRNACYTALGRRNGRAAQHDPAALLERVVAASDRPDDRLAIEEALRRLPPDQREVVHLKVFEGRTFQEIADVSGESINTVASRYRYGIDKLKDALTVGSY